MRTRIAFGLVTVLIASNASAAEPRIVWRSPTTGAIAAPPTTELPPVEEPTQIAIKYANNGRTFPRGMSMSLAPTINGGSGNFIFALGSISGPPSLPKGIVFNSATGIFSGNPETPGDFTFSILLHDTQTGQRVTAVVRFFVG